MAEPRNWVSCLFLSRSWIRFAGHKRKVNLNSINIKLNIADKVIIQESDTAMETKRYLKQVWLNLISALLGSIFGIMRSFAGALGFFENFVDRYVRNKKESRTIKDLINWSELIEDELYSRAIENTKHFKIMPAGEITETRI